MAFPRKVGRSGRDGFHGDPWNAFVDLCALEELQSLSGPQETLHFEEWTEPGWIDFLPASLVKFRARPLFFASNRC